MSITIGLWGIPLLITVVSFIWAHLWGQKHDPAGGWGSGIATMFMYLVVTVISLISWLIWAVIT